MVLEMQDNQTDMEMADVCKTYVRDKVKGMVWKMTLYYLLYTFMTGDCFWFNVDLLAIGVHRVSLCNDEW